MLHVSLGDAWMYFFERNSAGPFRVSFSGGQRGTLDRGRKQRWRCRGRCVPVLAAHWGRSSPQVRFCGRQQAHFHLLRWDSQKDIGTDQEKAQTFNSLPIHHSYPPSQLLACGHHESMCPGLYVAFDYCLAPLFTRFILRVLPTK